MNDFGFVFDERFKLHLTGAHHPEQPQRMDAVAAGLAASGVLRAGVHIEATPIDLVLVQRVHHAAYIARVRDACRRGLPYIDDPDSAICPASWDIACLAAGGVVSAARRIGAGELRRAFCGVRPPGHHAEVDRSMGFCLLNNVALAARVLLDEFGMERVLILDWDVHHGNGTQHIFEHDPSVLFVSVHGHPETLYPGTGHADEQGVGAGFGFTLNVPMPPASDDAAYQRAFEGQVLPVVERYRPQAVLISAGFDAHRADPIGDQALTEAGFVWMTETVLALAAVHAGGRVLSVLEGGYDLAALERCVGLHVERLAG